MEGSLRPQDCEARMQTPVAARTPLKTASAAPAPSRDREGADPGLSKAWRLQLVAELGSAPSRSRLGARTTWRLSCSVVRRPRSAALVAVLFVMFPLLPAQWLNYPTAGVPKLPNGKPNLKAATPRTKDGKPDL